MVDLQKKVATVFASADEDNKGFLTKGDYKVAIIQLFGYKPSKHEIATAWKEVWPEEGLILKSFTDLMLPRLQQQDTSERVRQTFMAFDRFCHGFISLEDCKSAFAKVSLINAHHCQCVCVCRWHLIFPRKGWSLSFKR